MALLTVLVALLLLLVLFTSTSLTLAKDTAANSTGYLPEIYIYKIVSTHHHDYNAYTQGLLYYGKNIFYESTGQYGQSQLREVDALTGKIKMRHILDPKLFGEGLALWKDRLLQISWRTNRGIVYNRDSLQQVSTFVHPMTDGWGLTTDSKQLIGSDGTSSLYFIDPTAYTLNRKIVVRDGDVEVKHLNELEYINGLVWANVWLTDCIAMISPSDGRVKGWLSLEELRVNMIAEAREAKAPYTSQIEVLNGIAWDTRTSRLFVTGKYWPRLYQIKPIRIRSPTLSNVTAFRNKCIIT